MPNERRDGALYSMEPAPRPSDTPNLESRSTHTIPGGIDTLLPPAPIVQTPSSRSDMDAFTTETRDYWNEGNPHNKVQLPPADLPRLDSLLAPPPMPANERRESDTSTRATSENLAGETASRRSVQFARPEIPEVTQHSQRDSFDEFDSPGKGRGGSFMSKIKAMTGGASSTQTPKSPTAIPHDFGGHSLANSPVATRTQRDPDSLAEGTYDADADAELTADELNVPDVGPSKRKKKRRMRRRKEDKNEPSTPNQSNHDGDIFQVSKRLLRRRASMPDTAAVANRGMSDDEMVRHRARPSMWRSQRSAWTDQANRPASDDNEELDSSLAMMRRRGHSRRATALGGGGVSDGDAVAGRRPLFGSERASTFGAHKWKQVKNTLKLLRQKKEDRFDYYKSAELMAELRAGAPAALMLASMIQRDEHGNKRIPVLLEQLKLRVVDSYPDETEDRSDRHWHFKFELEYGSGPSRMSWTITRSLTDLYNLHFRYKWKLRNEKYKPGRIETGARLKQPKFPWAAFPYMRSARGKRDMDESSLDEGQAGEATDTTPGHTVAATPIPEERSQLGVSDSEVPTPANARRPSRLNVLGMHRRSTGITDPGEMSNAEGRDGLLPPAVVRQRYVEKQRRILEEYLSNLIRWLMFRADSNRLCRFLELSALGVRLAAEGSYHGKEGYLHIQSSKGLDFRRVLTPAKMINRHSSKWFLVRQSYIVCVESPENMNIYDVYLVDNKFGIMSKRNALKSISGTKPKVMDLTREAPPDTHHTLTLKTSERQVRLWASSPGMMRDFELSINEMLRQTIWYQNKRFDSFAPVRQNVHAQWLVDGRDYMWNVSRAINMARDVIYIHDWWLSPELYMRRPACISQKWRLDRLLQKKAREGVKIFIIIYRNVEAAIPIDSEYTKFSLLNLHPNIFVQRSPNQFKKNQFFFAHHEKICIVDHDVAFVGGIDLCFGRWDSPQHPITDDKPTGFEATDQPRDADNCQLYPGKDYSNPRVQDFYRLNEPYEEMYDRHVVPRMPWHDISMQVVGQPARDLTRHFVQRWDYLRRGRKPTRPLPFLLPPPEAKMEELEELGLTGTCEVQILRSATTWSLGIEETEHSIQTAYIKMIEDSEHFVYMENQFFITSTEIYNTRITNRIGDALVDRIIRAHENDEDWRCVIIIPLMPGFQNTVDEQEGTSVRLILMCQYRSICRGEHSIFERLRAKGIDPEEYINFYSLRQWGIMSSGNMVTEQLYIHAKTIIVDDRVALIGSANINERSMLGSRDSECAAIVRDTDMMWSTMGGQPYQVGRFAHTLRLRLMREHLGLDVDEILAQERQHEMDKETFENEMNEIYAENTAEPQPRQRPHAPQRPSSFNHELDMEQAEAMHESDSSSERDREVDPRVENLTHQMDVQGHGQDNWRAAEKTGADQGRDTVIINGREVLVHNVGTEGKGSLQQPNQAHQTLPMPDNRYLGPSEAGSEALPPMPPFNRRTTEQLGLPRPALLPSLPVVDDTDIGGPPVHTDPVTGRPMSGVLHPMAADIKPAHIDKDCMRDPLDTDFMEEIWHRVAVNNTTLYRRVFRCMPDSEVSNWAEYTEYTNYGKNFRAMMEGRRPKSESAEVNSEGNAAHGPSTSGAAGVAAPGPGVAIQAAENEIHKIPEKIADKTPGVNSEHQQAHGHMPHIITPSAPETAELNEKPPIEAEKARPTLETGVANEKQRAPEASSPVYSQGDVPFPAMENGQTKFLEPQISNKARERRTTFSTLEKPASRESGSNSNLLGRVGSVRNRRRANTKNSRRGFTLDDMPTRQEAEVLMNMTQGHLVQFPYNWLATEETNGNWGYQVDGVAPLAI
ncbi:Phospholipase D1-like protein [Emericellopsis cladophorae]|uniref:Phospholipase n=1 Tax=Emericellopsis cladophorae TaxID=2686198 RepID=A0A9P9Y181_9HYPO|nr:Phospholipase D1-like protein [Emericellopsis cladophorae]KAI6781708.1 Phospholipase D1-like protein [Emericellopsis cladophorae]